MEEILTDKDLKDLKMMLYRALPIPFLCTLLLSGINIVLWLLLDSYNKLLLFWLIELFILLLSISFYRFLTKNTYSDIKSGIKKIKVEEIIEKKAGYFSELGTTPGKIILGGKFSLGSIILYVLFPKLKEKNKKFYLITESLNHQVDQESYETTKLNDQLIIQFAQLSGHIFDIEIKRR